MNKLSFVLSNQDLNRGIEDAIYTAKNQKGTLHRLLVAACIHVQLHGDTRPLTRLITGLKEQGRHVRVNAMVKVVQHYCPLHFDTKEKKFRVVKKVAEHSAVGEIQWDVDAMIRDPFYSSKLANNTSEGSNWSPEHYEKIVLATLKKHGVNVIDFATKLVKDAA